MAYREKIKDLKLNFRYLCDNTACLSVDNINGKPVHNDINNEEAIIIFNSLVGEKDNCQTVKTLLEENAELKKHLEIPEKCILKTLEGYKSYYEDCTKEQILEDTYIDYCAYVNLAYRYSELEKDFEDKIVSEMNLRDENRRLRKEYQDTYKDVRIEIKEYKSQQKEFIKYLEDEIKRQKEEIFANSLTSEDIDLYIMRIKLLKLEEIISKYKEIIGDAEDE